MCGETDLTNVRRDSCRNRFKMLRSLCCLREKALSACSLMCVVLMLSEGRVWQQREQLHSFHMRLNKDALSYNRNVINLKMYLKNIFKKSTLFLHLNVWDVYVCRVFRKVSLSSPKIWVWHYFVMSQLSLQPIRVQKTQKAHWCRRHLVLSMFPS